MNNDRELLFEYLRSILYDSSIKKIDLEDLDEPYRKLGAGLQVLQREVEELKTYAEDLAKGNLSGEHPSKDNLLCAELKNIHANLNHLTWQAKQVAAGDYSQHVSNLGEFSEAFNEMIHQLKERKELLLQEAATLQKKVQMIEDYNAFLMKMTRKRNEWILVVDAETREVLYCNKQEDTNGTDRDICKNCKVRITIHDEMLNWADGEQKAEWEAGDVENGYYRITTFPAEWKGRSAYAHSAEDITERKKMTERLTNKAYIDGGTAIYNRMFFKEYMEKAVEDKKQVTLCYMDLDGLKFVNDNFGHKEGDAYIQKFVSVIQGAFRSTDVFARIGGDEFCLVLNNIKKEVLEQKLQDIRTKFIEQNKEKYPVSFSYGVLEIDETAKNLQIEEILNLADEEMYMFKRKNKKQRTL